jgi:RNA polymerase sigma factor (sigma-70 family)
MISMEAAVWLRRWFRSHSFGKRSIGLGTGADAGEPGRATKTLRVRAPFAGYHLEGPALVNGQLAFELDPELSAQLRMAARAHDMPPETLAADLLTRGLEQEALRAQAEAALAILTPREQEVAWLTARGHTNQQIAGILVISPETVKTHVRRVLGKFGVRSKSDLRLLLLDLGVRWWEG